MVAYRLRKHAVIDMATIERRGDVGGFVSSIPPEDQFVQWRSEREIDVMTALASLAGERMFFDGDHTMGVGGDMRTRDGDDHAGARVLRHGRHDRLPVRHPRGDARCPAGRDRARDRAMFDSRVRQARRGQARELATRRPGSCSRRTGPRCSRSRTRWRPRKTITGDDVAAIIDGDARSLDRRAPLPRPWLPPDARATTTMPCCGRTRSTPGSRPDPRARCRRPPSITSVAERHRQRRTAAPADRHRPALPASARRRSRPVARSARVSLAPCGCTTPCPGQVEDVVPLERRARHDVHLRARPCTAPPTSGTSARSCSVT